MIRLARAICGVMLFAALTLHAQEKGEPGKFDFYLLNVVPSTEFCAIKDVGPGCHSRPGFVLHGLWAQNDNGTYPVFCAERAGPKHPERNLDITPDLTLLGHEWMKHGTCTTLSAEAFFAAERRAYRAFVVPPMIAETDHVLTMKPEEIVADFEAANLGFPRDSIIVWCSAHKLTSVSACLSKDLKPVVCRGLKSCADAMIEVAPTHAPLH
jgi:ribonuclease T2